jgi:hypothetical protein
LQVTLTRTRQSGNFWLSGTLQINNPAQYSMWISSVALTSTAGQFGTLPPNCIGGNVANPNMVNGVADTVGGIGAFELRGGIGVFELRAGAQIDCDFNISAGTGSAPQGNIQAMATIASGTIGTTGNAAYSSEAPIDFVNPTQQWDIGGCVSFTDTATTAGFAGTWIPQLTGLPAQQQICESRTWTYTGAITPVPVTGATCNQPVTVSPLMLFQIVSNKHSIDTCCVKDVTMWNRWQCFQRTLPCCYVVLSRHINTGCL